MLRSQQRVERKSYYHSSKRDSTRRMVIDCNKINEECSATNKHREQRGWHQHLPYPRSPSESGIERSSEVPIDRRWSSVDKDSSAQKRTPSGNTKTLLVRYRHHKCSVPASKISIIYLYVKYLLCVKLTQNSKYNDTQCNHCHLITSSD